MTFVPDMVRETNVFCKILREHVRNTTKYLALILSEVASPLTEKSYLLNKLPYTTAVIKEYTIVSCCIDSAIWRARFLYNRL